MGCEKHVLQDSMSGGEDIFGLIDYWGLPNQHGHGGAYDSDCG